MDSRAWFKISYTIKEWLYICFVIIDIIAFSPQYSKEMLLQKRGTIYNLIYIKSPYNSLCCLSRLKGSMMISSASIGLYSCTSRIYRNQNIGLWTCVMPPFFSFLLTERERLSCLFYTPPREECAKGGERKIYISSLSQQVLYFPTPVYKKKDYKDVCF